MDKRPLTALSVRELKDAIEKQSDGNLSFNYNDLVYELERRAQQKNNNKVFWLSFLALVVSIVSLVISVFK